MPALPKPPARLPRFVPHLDSGTHPRANAGTRPGATAGASRRAGTFGGPASILNPSSGLIEAAKTAPSRPETLERLAHDARNILSSLMLHAELLSAPGVLNAEHSHFAPELDSMTRAAARLTEKILDLALLDPALPTPSSAAALSIAAPQPLHAIPVTDLASELRHLQPLLAAIAGPSIRLSIATMPCAGRTRLTVEDLTRILVNLVRNAADAMPSGGQVRIAAQYGDGQSFLDPANTSAFGPPSCILLSVADNGPGIPAHLRGRVFDFGVTTRNPSPVPGSPAPRRRGLGLGTVRQLVESAGGIIRLSESPAPGARFEVSIPLIHATGEIITSGTYRNHPNNTLGDDSTAKGRLECR